MTNFAESTIEEAAVEWLKMSALPRKKAHGALIRMISGWTMLGLGRNRGVHLIRKIMVQDDALLPKLMRGEVRVKDVEKEL